MIKIAFTKEEFEQGKTIEISLGAIEIFQKKDIILEMQQECFDATEGITTLLWKPVETEEKDVDFY